ncbi:Phosphatidylinositol 4-phosphate 5-kinase 6 (AtPIP5K6) (1-phosphatidylinositol 4-phosphate kinase 6) (Diphosphoinositide kinase 6) (PtdIns(4)P-5-kinase 6) [Durusdinium trenchii]|uniref:Phosphatidylinositol 4-phosphate 5-kinase 6 (AtPIP5K6) (1-phosphatidylinositol 4-phosphate kinase 6) (Diphosphoinositide kinase 6) (PtdIns(4)P-5-kinase 6) n=1 Tax=Durusdinium trenchii TaxID=1381693 RepID=A0ABP0M338_9DINO
MSDIFSLLFKADGYNATRLPLRETRPGRPQVPSRLPDEHVNRKDNTLNIEHLMSEKRSGLDFGVVNPRRTDSDKLTTNRLVKDQRIFSNGNSYVGTWLNGRMHGEGHYIWSDGSEYFGEFHEGYMWGNGKKTWPTGRTYDGEWRKDQMWGEGKMTWPSGEEYIGSLKKGVFHGKGTRTWPNGDRYAGSFKHEMQDGEGTFESAEEGWVYSGQWLQNRMNGRGKVKWPNGIEYDGEWKDGIREGKGKLTWADGSSYKGEFQHNCIEGKGKKTLPDGSWFEGQFHDSELEGRGTFHWPDGTEFEGLWHNSEIVGPGCHRFPNGTMITGVFENHGATGEGTKKWANGSMYTGTLLNNSIHKYGVFQWPDGRRYIGQFQDEMMHGEGMLCWSDDFGVCRYKGTFEHNVFQGHGVLEWSVKARYVGEFFNGLYHGEGTFEWPDKANVYRGQWQFGEMSGRGTLTTSCGSVCSGEFHAGNMEGRGTITFITNDQYTGEFKDSMFNGLGCYTWSSGVTLTGVFENNVCSKVGKKTYTNGLIYVGELFEDQEHGRGVLTDASGTRIVGVWNNGRLEEELVEMIVSATEAKAQLLKYLGCFTGSGNAADVRTLISDLEQLSTELPSSLAGDWTLIGDTASSRPPLLMRSFQEGERVLRSVSMSISEDMMVRIELLIGAFGRSETLPFEAQLQIDRDNKRKVSLADGAMTITYLDDDFLILRDDSDPFVFLEGRLRDFYVKREVYLRSTPNGSKPRFWRSYLDWRETLPQVPLWLLSGLQAYGVALLSSSSPSPSYGKFTYVPKASRISICFEPEMTKPLVLCQLDSLNDPSLIWALLQYVLWEYRPAQTDPSVEMRASMYTNMLYSAFFWPASFVAACAVLRVIKRKRAGRQLHVVELACGTALPSLAALASGTRVTSTDISLLSLRLAEQSAHQQGEMEEDFSTRVFDIINEPPQNLLDLNPDVVVASDLLYNEPVAKALGHQLGVAAANGATVITTDAGRLDGQGQKIFLESFWASSGAAAETGFAQFQKEVIPDRILDLGVNAMKYGKAIAIFANGDKYVGCLQSAQKEGDGMYVYADASAYKGVWSADSLDGESHPQGSEAQSSVTSRIHDLNARNAEAVAAMKTKLPGERKQVPPVAKIQD